MPANRWSRSEPIAVVGIGCRLPGGADDPDQLWRLLADGRDAVAPIPADRWDHAAWYDPDPAATGKTRQREAGLLDRIDAFDAAHFGISPREAEAMDPQQRLLLETVWHALADAGEIGHARHGGRVGVFVGLYNDNYGLIGRGSPDPGCIGGWSASGTHTSVAAGRIAFTFDFTGPAVAVDTACSSSLVAVHLAIQSLRAGECDLAVAGGVHLLLSPLGLVASSKLGATSPDARCKPFDARADGFGHAEGCGVVVLRRLGEVGSGRVRAVVSGSAVGQDGRSAGLTAPSGPAQVAVVRAALADAGLAADTVDAIEAHGTGTALGDPIEAHALAAVFAERDRPLWVGSIKSNMGHAEAAAGVAGLIKAVLMVERGSVPTSLHFERLNPHIDTGSTDIRVPRTAQPVRPRAVGVSSFGFSGTNAHVLVAPAPETAATTAAAVGHTPRLLISARTPEALAQLTAAYRHRLEAAPAAFADLCHSAAVGRAQLPWWVCVERPEDLATAEPQHGPHPDLGPQPGRQVPLPLYPFERQRYWIDTSTAPAPTVTALPKGAHPLLGRRLPLPFSDERRFETELSTGDPELAWLGEHRVLGHAVLPAAAILELLHALAPQQEASELELLLPILVPDQPARRLQTILAADGQCLG